MRAITKGRFLAIYTRLEGTGFWTIPDLIFRNFGKVTVHDAGVRAAGSHDVSKFERDPNPDFDEV